MKFRTGLVIGIGIGTVIGMRLGDERVDRFVSSAQRLLEDERVAPYIDKAMQATLAPRNKAREVVADQLRNAGDELRDRST